MMNELYYNSVEGWFSHGDVDFYKLIVNNASENSHFVEVGSWKGKSSSCMATFIINSNKNIKFDCVDTWKGSPELLNDKDLIAGNLLNVFIENMKPFEGYYSYIQLPSIEAAKLYEDESLDFVFIDGAHDYDSVCADIQAWLPKVKINGVLAGHDYYAVRRAVHTILTDIDGIRGSCWMYKKIK